MDAAESELHGDVDPQTASGVIRYRMWPARRHPLRTLAALLVIGAATAGAWYAYESVLWSGLTLLGLTATAAVFFFPTLVSLDGPLLHMRQFGSPRTFDLRTFRRMEVAHGVMPRVELGTTATVSTLDPVKGTLVPLPANPHIREQVVLHLRRWVGRRPSGIFEMDADLAPEDEQMATAAAG